MILENHGKEEGIKRKGKPWMNFWSKIIEVNKDKADQKFKADEGDKNRMRKFCRNQGLKIF